MKDNVKSSSKPRKYIAEKNFTLKQNDFHLEIKKGDDLSKVPEKYIQNLKTEKVIK